MRLPYEKVEAFKLGGVLHPTEQEALFAAVEQHVGKSGVASTVVGKACELAPLLARLCELGGADEPQEQAP